MKLPKTNIVTETGNILESKHFSIKNEDSGIIFDILRKKMYSDPIKAIAREISCNARDAHIEVGTPDKPIKIYLPTPLDPNLKIQDFGPGISPDRIYNIFIYYGSSTKRDTNEQVGGWGIGAKTPFAYHDSFSIITIYNGIKYHYSAYIDESNSGKLDLLRKEKTTESNGTTIIVPVKKDDYSYFAKAIVDATSFWDVRPELYGGISVPSYIDFGDPLLEEDNWKLYKYRNEYGGYGRATSKILIEGIVYNFEASNIDLDKYCYLRDINNKKQIYYHALYNLTQHELHLKFKIGELSLSSNRETIHFDDATKKAIINRLSEVQKVLLSHCINKIQTSKNLIEAEKLWHDFTTQFPSLTNNKKAHWNNIKLKGITRHFTCNIYDKRRKKKIRKSVPKVTIENFYWHLKPQKNEWVVRKQTHNSINIDRPLFINDKDTKIASRKKINHYMESQISPSASYKERENHNINVISFHSENIRKYCFQKFDLAHLNLIPLSTLSDPPKSKSSKKVKRKVREDFDAYLFDPNYAASRTDDRFWRPCIIKKEVNKGTYVIVNNKREWNIKSGLKGVISDEDGFTAMSCTAVNQIIKDQIYGIKRRDLSKLSNNWTLLGDVAAPIIKDLIKDYNPNINYDGYRYLLLDSAFRNIDNIILTNKDLINSNSTMKKYIDASQKFNKLLEEHAIKYRLYKDFPKYRNKNSQTSSANIDSLIQELKDLYEKVYKFYPMLKHTHYGISNQIYIDYINMVDKVKNNV